MADVAESKKIVYRGETTDEQISNAILADRLEQILNLLASYMGRVPPDLVNTIRLCQQDRLMYQGDDGKDAPEK